MNKNEGTDENRPNDKAIHQFGFETLPVNQTYHHRVESQIRKSKYLNAN
jgi:hypothetical protein